MHVRQQMHLGEQERRTLSEAVVPMSRILMVVGVVILALALVFGFLRGDGLAYFFHAYLVSFCFYLSISLGGLFFVALQHASRAGWSVAVRRSRRDHRGQYAGDGRCCSCRFLLPLLWGNTALYEWLNPQLVAEDHVLSGQERLSEPALLYAASRRLFCRVGSAWCGTSGGDRSNRIESGDANLTLADGTRQLPGVDPLRRDDHVRRVRLDHVADAALVQHDLRRVLLFRGRGGFAGGRDSDPVRTAEERAT